VTLRYIIILRDLIPEDDYEYYQAGSYEMS